MKKTHFIVLALLALILCIVSCNHDTPVKTGTLEITIDVEASRGIQAIPMETKAYRLTVKNSVGETVLDISNGNQTSYSFSTPAGEYSIDVEALNVDGEVIGLGSGTATVVAGQTHSVNIIVSEMEGNGTFSMSISANDGYQLTYSIRNASGSEVKSGSLSYSEGNYSASENLPNGFYSFAIVRTDTGKTIKSDTVRIIKGKTAVYDATFQFLTDGSINVVNEIPETPSINISLNSNALKNDSTLTASATITGIAGYSCFWAVDQIPQSDASDYSDLELPLSGMSEGVHSVALFVNNNDKVWAESVTFSILPDRPTEIVVAGDVELWMIGDVLIPWDFEITVNVGLSIFTFRPIATHGMCTLDDEGETISIQSFNLENYDAYLDSRFNEATGKTDVYVIIDKYIEDPAFIEVSFPEFITIANYESYGVWFDADSTVLNPNITPQQRGRKGLVTITNDRASRIIKVDPDTYRQNGTCGSFESHDDTYYEIELNRNPFTLAAGETKQSTWSILEITTFAEVEVPDVSIYPDFAEKAKYISLHIGENGIGGWSTQYFPTETFSYTEPLRYLGENLAVSAVVELKEGFDEDDFPYMIVPNVQTLTVEEGNTYSVSFSVQEKASNQPLSLFGTWLSPTDMTLPEDWYVEE